MIKNKKAQLLLLIVIAYLFTSTNNVFADTTSWVNLVGIQAIHENIFVDINLSGSESFQVDQNIIKKTVEDDLKLWKIPLNTTEGLPVLHISIQGETTGGGGADYNVEILLSANMKSPFVANKNIQAIIWKAMASEHQLMRYDPSLKKLVVVPGNPKDRIILSVQAVLSKLLFDIKKANPDLCSITSSEPQKDLEMPKVIIPEAINKKWSAVKLLIEDKKTIKTWDVDIKLNKDYKIPNSNLLVRVDAFLPDFNFNAEKKLATSTTNDPNNPAVRVTIYENSQIIFNGWLYAKFPAITPFEHSSFGISLKEGA